MQYRSRDLFFFFILAICSANFYSCASKNDNSDEVVVPDSNTPPPTDPNVIPQFVNTDYIELNKIQKISKFRPVRNITCIFFERR